MSHTLHTFTAAVALRNLMSDMCGDEASGLLPHNFAMRASTAALRGDNRTLASMYEEQRQLLFDAFMINNIDGAERCRSACQYLNHLRHIVDNT